MPEVILSDYFYGAESEEFIYFKIPRLLITDPKFKHVSTDAKLLYGMLLDRMGLSAKNDWYDDHGRVYIYYTVDEICEDMCCGRDKAMKLLAELDKKKGIGLIERVKQGQGRPTKLYVKRFTTRTAPTMRIAGEVLPTETVKARFRKLNSSHIEYIIEAMNQTTTKINNIRAYLLTALYNAPVTMGPYYSAAVRHDFG